MNRKKRTLLNGLSRRDFLVGAAGVGALGQIPFGPARSQAAVPTKRGYRMKIFIFSKHLQWLDYAEMAQTAKTIGFDGCDLTVRPGGHVLPERVKDDLPRAAAAMKKSGLDVAMMVTRITDPRDKYTRPILETAGKLGFKYYRTGGFYYDRNKSIPAQLAEIRPKLRDLAAMNREYGLHGAYQNHSGSRNVGAPVWDIWELIKDLDPRWLGCQYDIRHGTVEGGTAWPTNFRLIAPHVTTIIAKDFSWVKTSGGWNVLNCPLGQGMVDFGSYFKMVKEAEIGRLISLHLEYDLGGADKGKRTLTIPREKVLEAMRRDLGILQGYLTTAKL